jgi:uncharacterized protein YecT (DUF1311 family)
MNPFVWTILALGAQLATGRAAAMPQETARRHDPCLEALTPLEVHACAVTERRRAHGALRRLFRRVLRATPAADRKALAREHDEWQRNVHVRCAREAAAFQGGTLLPVVMSTCLTNAADARAEVMARRLRR